MMKEGDRGINLSRIVIPKASGVPKSLFCVSTSKGREDVSVSFPCIGRVIFSHVFAFAQFVGKAWKTKLTQQLTHLLMENPMV